jgi:hypothetical protein
MMLLMSRMVEEQRQAGFVDDDDDDEDEDDDTEDIWDTEDEDDEDTEDEDDEDEDELFDGMYEPGMHHVTVREDDLYADDLHRRYAGMDDDQGEDEDKDEDDDEEDDLDQDDDEENDKDRDKVTLAGNVDIAAKGDKSRDFSLEVTVNKEEESI